MPTRFEYNSEVVVEGYRSDVDNSGLKVLGEGLDGQRAIGAGADSLEHISTSAADDTGQANCTGVEYVYVNSAGEYVTAAPAAPDGLAAIAVTLADLQWLMAIRAVTFGANKVNAGDITLRVAAAGQSRGKLRAGRNGWQPGRYIVPKGKVGILEEALVELAVGAVTVPAELRVEADVVASSIANGKGVATRNAGVFHPLACQASKGALYREWRNGLRFPELTEIRTTAALLAAGSGPASSMMRFRLEDA